MERSEVGEYGFSEGSDIWAADLTVEWFPIKAPRGEGRQAAQLWGQDRNMPRIRCVIAPNPSGMKYLLGYRHSKFVPSQQCFAYGNYCPSGPIITQTKPRSTISAKIVLVISLDMVPVCLLSIHLFTTHTTSCTQHMGKLGQFTALSLLCSSVTISRN